MRDGDAAVGEHEMRPATCGLPVRRRELAALCNPGALAQRPKLALLGLAETRRTT
jgi:hypothetical protein